MDINRTKINLIRFAKIGLYIIEGLKMWIDTIPKKQKRQKLIKKKVPKDIIDHLLT